MSPIPSQPAGEVRAVDIMAELDYPGEAHSAGARDQLLEGFAQGRWYDVAPPSGWLALQVSDVSQPEVIERATDDEVLGIGRAWKSMETWAFAGKLGVVRELIRRYPLNDRSEPDQPDEPSGQPDEPGQPKQAKGSRGLPEEWDPRLHHEVAAALAISVVAAGRLVALAWTLEARLPGIGAALADGRLDPGRVKLIAEETAVLDDDAGLLAGCEAIILAGLESCRTWADLQRLVQRAVLTVDPQGAEKRRKRAEREDARVRLWREAAGTCGLQGIGLPTDEALAAMAHVEDRARQYRAAAIRRPADLLRVMAFLDILNGVTVAQRAAWIQAEDAALQAEQAGREEQAERAARDARLRDARLRDATRRAQAKARARQHAGPGDPGDGDGEDPGHGHGTVPEGDWPDDDGPGAGGGGEGPGSGPDDGGPVGGGRGSENDAGPDGDDGGPRGSRPRDTGDGGGGPRGDGPDDDGPGSGRGSGPDDGHLPGGGDGGYPRDWPVDDGGSGDEGPGGLDDQLPPEGPCPRCGGAGGGTGLALRVNLTLPAGAVGWLGERPARARGPGGSGPGGTRSGGGGPGDHGRGYQAGPGAGPCPACGRPADGSTAARRDLALPLLTVLGLAERPGEAHGLGGLDPALVRVLAAAAARDPGSRFCVTITDEHGIAVGHGCGRPVRGKKAAAIMADASSVGATFIPSGEAGPDGGFGSWIMSLPGAPHPFTVDIDVMATYDCDHRNASPGYRPSDKLRHLIQVRDGACSFPACSRHARETDFEHAQPFDKGGRTCACNAHSCSRSCHRVKQSPGWRLAKPRPGWTQWTTMAGRSYVQGPWQYPA